MGAAAFNAGAYVIGSFQEDQMSASEETVEFETVVHMLDTIGLEDRELEVGETAVVGPGAALFFVTLGAVVLGE